MATVVERATRFTALVQLDRHDMLTVLAGLSRTMTRLPEQLRRSLTWDRGMELADHKNVTINTGLDVYFADPRSPWQRGTNENTVSLGRAGLGLAGRVGVGCSSWFVTHENTGRHGRALRWTCPYQGGICQVK